MTPANQMTYEGIAPRIGQGATLLPGAFVIGRVHVGDRLYLGACATLRGDGESIEVGDDCRFGARATVHIADGLYPTHIGNRVTVGRFAVVHACTVRDDCVIGDGAIVMDQAELGPGAVLAAGTFVPPRKRLDGGWLYQGSPAVAIRRLAATELEMLRADVATGRCPSPVCSDTLPPPDASSFLAQTVSDGPLLAIPGTGAPRCSPDSYVAPSALVAGAVTLDPRASIWFACVLIAAHGEIRIGADSNVQDNTIIEADTGTVLVGRRVTIGHNVRMRSALVEDDCLIGIGSVLGTDVTVEQGACVAAGSIVPAGAVVDAGWIWAGRPARAFRPLRDTERELFHAGMQAYVRYTSTYGD